MRRIREAYERYERKLSAGSILVGFVFDTLTLVRIDLLINYVLMFVYLGIAGAGIFLINLREEGKLRIISDEAYSWLFIAMQFSFGGLFGRFFLYYFHSGLVSESWLFLLALLALLVGNEFAKKHYARLALQLHFFFLALYLFLIFFIPIVVNRIGSDVFLVSGALAVLIMYIFARGLLRLAPERIQAHTQGIALQVGLVFLVMNILYFANIIPPIPLSLRDAGVYHSVVRMGSGYTVLREKKGPFSVLPHRQVVHVRVGDALAVYSAVFAPTDFDTSIVHEWQYYNDAARVWETRSTVVLPIVGGKDTGYRGYSIKTNLAPGRWRVNIETLKNQVIGRLTFMVEIVDHKPELVTEQI